MKSKVKLGSLARTAVFGASILLSLAVSQAEAAKRNGNTSTDTCFGTAQGSGTTCNVRGVFPEFVGAGKCAFPNGVVDPNTSASLVFRKSQGIWQMSMVTTGANAAGSWVINYQKAGIPGPTASIDAVSGGWAAVLYNTKTDKGTIQFDATAINVSPSGVPRGDTCTAHILMTF
jgi:hypothetical protein